MPRFVWKTEVKRCVDEIALGQLFTLTDMSRIAPILQQKFPRNNHVPEKIRQTLQYLRDDGCIEFVDDNGTYRRLK